MTDRSLDARLFLTGLGNKGMPCNMLSIWVIHVPGKTMPAALHVVVSVAEEHQNTFLSG